MNRICVWSGPRNVSTALMYSFAQRSDTRVVDEPLYAAYLAQSPRAGDHPVPEEVMASQPVDLQEAVEVGMLGPCDRPVLFLKNMAQHWRGVDPDVLGQFQNVLLFRHPALVARSFKQIVEAPTAEDLGYPMQIEILDELIARGLPIVALDSANVRNEPAAILRGLCEKVGIEFDPSMLSWEAGPRPEDGVWAAHWYGNVHKSTGFAPDHATPPDLSELPANLRPVVEECLPLYERLSAL